jgi:hypothetical protein
MARKKLERRNVEKFKNDLIVDGGFLDAAQNGIGVLASTLKQIADQKNGRAGESGKADNVGDETFGAAKHRMNALGEMLAGGLRTATGSALIRASFDGEDGRNRIAQPSDERHHACQVAIAQDHFDH